MSQTTLRVSLWILILSMSFGVAGCKSTPTTQGSATRSGEVNDLSWDQARSRAALIEEPSYSVKVSLDDKKTHFTGSTEILFRLKGKPADLRLDFYEGTTTNMSVNGSALPDTAKKKYWIEIPAHLLKEGQNTFRADYSAEYSTQGQGLHRFIDPETKQAFLHTQFQTYDANRFMPCFDQPDLRASLSLTVEAPASWEVIAATPSTTVHRKAKRKTWTFEPTPPIATYIFALHAGPYKVWTDRYENIPLRLFVRPTLAKFVQPKDWFRSTKQGFKFFNEYFGYPYPFKKYDQLIVPEFNAGAMENVAAITFSERFVKRSAYTRDDRRGRTSVLLHEMAHMWFGNIVTMKWWNDLWLNESFASYLAALALHEATEFKEAWHDFFVDDKTWAYWEDSLSTTHPIEPTVPSVKVAYATFDGITYGKGAAVLKQLNAYISPQAFKKGIQTYIKTYAFKSTELKDFIAALQTQTDKDLSLWADRWLRQSGTDKVAVKWACESDRLAQIQIFTTTSPGAKFRPQRIQLALFQARNGELVQPQIVPVELTKGLETIKGPWPCPTFVYSNYQDDGYLAVSLDINSLNYVKEHLSRIKDPLLRTMLWNDLWQMVRALEMPLKDYVQIIEKHFPLETDLLLLGQIVRTISGRGNERSSILQYWPDRPETQLERQRFTASIERQYLNRFRSARAGSDAQKFWFDNYVTIGRSNEALDQMAKWYEKETVAKGFKLDPDRQWNLIRQLARYQHAQAGAFLARQKIKDASDRGKRAALAAEAIRPDLEIKKKWVAALRQPQPTVNLQEARSVAGSLFPLEQTSLAQRFANDFYDYVKANASHENEYLVGTVAVGLTPLSCSQDQAVQLRSFLKGSTDFSPTLAKTLKVILEEDERCLRVRAMSRL